MKTRALKILCFLFFGLFLFSFPLLADATDPLITLDGIHKVSPDDNPLYSSPEFDDSRWQNIIVPGSWQSQDIKPSQGIGWYRIHCFIPESFRKNALSVFLGRIGDADEVFFNGIKIGGRGLISDNFIEASKIVRLYKIPAGYIRFQDDNVIAVRVLNTYLNGGFFDKGIALGNYNLLLIEKMQRDRSTLLWEFCFFTLFGLFFIACLFFYIKGLRDREYLYFWIFITLYSLLFFLGSVTFYETGLKTPFIQSIINALSTLLPVSLSLLLMHFYNEKLNTYTKSMIIAFLSLTILSVFFHTYTLRMYIFTAWKLLFLVTAIFLIFLAIKAFFRKFYESGVILLGITGMIIGLILESVVGVDFLQTSGFFLWDYSTAFFMICVMYALTSRFTRIRELQSASVKIFDAHEQERKRLARELHDGIGTSLLATKMKLQMLESHITNNQPVDEKPFNELISEISYVIDELRNVSMDLRPSFLENTGLVEAMKWHARKIKERSGIEVEIRTGNIQDISPKIKENIYRIFQEALNNSVKHSGANKVDILLSREKNFLMLEILDNGKGFNLSDKGLEEQGLGLFTIRERVELLNGIIRIRSSDKIGTDIYIEVPIK